MMWKIANESGPPLKPEDILEYEKLVGARLPRDYHEFLLEYNGGMPEPRYVPVKHPEGSMEIRTLQSIGHSITSCDLSWNFRTFRARLPDQVVPIAHDSSGDRFCICLRGPNRSKIYFFDQLEHGSRVAKSLSDLHFVANRFTDMMDNLRPMEHFNPAQPE